MGNIYTLKQIKQIVEIDRKLQKELSNFGRTETEGPNAIGFGKRAAKKILEDIIPRYREIVPREDQDILGVNLNELEKRCKLYIDY